MSKDAELIKPAREMSLPCEGVEKKKTRKNLQRDCMKPLKDTP